jgi:hypothetical protein
MLQYKIIHIMPQDKFIEPFISFVENNFDFKEHLFVVIDYKNNHIIPKKENVIKISSLFLSRFKIDYDYSNKIIIHGLFRYIPIFLFFNQKLIEKSYWIIWGHDLYSYKNANKNLYTKVYEYMRKIVIQKLDNYIVYMDSEFELMKKVYDTNGRHFKSFIYLSNLYEPMKIDAKISSTINILIGNSASDTNHHLEILEKLRQYKNDDIKLIVPLSYSGTQDYIDKVIKKGQSIFGDKFIAILDYMDYSEYMKLLSTIDIAVFNHDRQQGIGNTNLLISFGVKIYLRKDTSQWRFYNDEDIKVFDIENLNMDKILNEDKDNNQNILKRIFSKDNLKKQLKDVFDA